MSVLIWELDILVFDSRVLSLCSLYLYIYTWWGSNLGSSEWEYHAKVSVCFIARSFHAL